MAQYVYTMNRVGKTVPPKRVILKDISLSFFPGAKIGVLGLNGSGKSSLLRIMAGEDKEYEGEATPMPGLRVGFLPQEPRLDPAHTVRQAVEEGMGEVLQAKEQLEKVYAAYAEPDADFDALAAEQARLEAVIAASGADSSVQMEVAADALGLPPWDAVIGNLSGGEKRRVALCRLLLSKPDMLLLDEPTNHLDAESVEWLEHFLQRFPGTVVAITHDRYFLDNAAEWILELDRGMGIPYKGNYSDWLDQKEKRLEVEQKKEDARIKAMKEELKWVRSNAKGRQTKSKARLARFEELSDVDYQRRNETNEIFIPVAERLGNEVIEFKNVSKGFGDRVLIDNLSFKVPPGAIVGIIGPNGAGKSTLFRMIQGIEQPDSGEVVIGKTARLAFVDVVSAGDRSYVGRTLTIATGAIRAAGPGGDQFAPAWIPGSDVPVFGGPGGSIQLSAPAAGPVVVVPARWAPDGRSLVATMYPAAGDRSAALARSIEVLPFGPGSAIQRLRLSAEEGASFFGWVRDVQ